MIRRLLSWLVGLLPPPRVIFDRDGHEPYLSRWYIIGAPHNPNGGPAFIVDGRPVDGIVWSSLPFGLYIHRFHQSDDGGQLHNHPWRWAVSLVLAGGYSEERRVYCEACGANHVDERVVRRDVRPGRINVITSKTFHRVDLLEDDAWTLFLVGPKFSGWGFWTRETGEFLPWREYIARRRGEPRSASTNGARA